jgi:hypothetical protein
MSETFNPRAVPGDNQAPDHAQIVIDRLADDYREAVKNVDELLDEARDAAPVVNSDPEALTLGALIKRLRDADTRLEAYREAEKQPYLRGGNAVDNFFHALRDKIARRRKGDRAVCPGAIDILQSRIDVWQQQKEAARRAELERERLEAARVAREQDKARRMAEQAAEEARLAAERARRADTQATKGAIADNKAGQAALARAQAELAAEQAEEARLATLVKAADITRVRGNDASGAGVILTTAREPYAMLVDRALVDMEALRPYFTDFEIETAVRGWAKSTGHKVQMAGAEIGFRNKGVTR